MKHLATIIIFLTIAGAAGGALIFGWYPAAIVNSRIIWARELNQITVATLTYYQQTVFAASAMPPAAAIETKRAALEILIDRILVSEAIRRVVDEIEIAALAQKKLAAYTDTPEFATAVSLVYGLELNQLYELVAIPEAEKELLQKKQGTDNEQFEKWLRAERANAKIIKFMEY